MLCSRCKKRQAVVFVTGVFGDRNTENAGLCLTCAREVGIPQVDMLMKQMGMTDDDVEAMEDRLAEMAGDENSIYSQLLGRKLPAEESDDDEDFEDDDDEFDDIADLDEQPSDDTDSGENGGNVGADTDRKKPLRNDGKKNKSPQIVRLPDELVDMLMDDDDEDMADEDDDDDGESDMPSFPLINQIFGKDFQPGGARYSDGAADGSTGKGRSRQKKHKLKFLNNYCTNLTERAAKNEIDRVIGRDREIERMVQILSRRQKNNPCLIGEPGVGKTALAEGLAIRIANGDVPQRLLNKQVYLLDLTALVAGTQFRGQFESRIKGLIDEVKLVGNVILFIDEMHNLVGTGDAEGSMNAANILKPALSRGELQVIGATTFTEYRKHIEKDAALERRFQPIKIEEPSVADTIEVLKGIKDYYEQHHGVTFSDALIARAVNLSERYITDRFLPDKAIDLLDEACACASLRNKARDEYERLSTDLKVNGHTQEKLMQRAEEKKTEPDYARLATLKSEAMRLEERLAEIKPEADDCAVTESDLAKVIELWTGVQASRIEESEYTKLAQLSQRMKEKIKGQDEAVELVASAIRRSRVQISPRRRPASFIFVGPTGVGKTELVKVLAGELFDTPETLIRLDMSEFMEKHSVSRLIGSPPGYVGYDEAGQLTEKVRRKPYSVLLFDEIEKAHPDVLNILLQILDEGRINDAQGRTVNFENTVLIMTSNAGSDNSSGILGFAKSENEIAKEKAMKALAGFLRPEFLARVDEVVCFNTLSDEDFRAIAKLMCDEYIAPMREKGIELSFSDEALAWLASHARGGKSAARDLRNLIRREVEDKLAQLIIDRCDRLPESAIVTVAEDKLAVTAD